MIKNKIFCGMISVCFSVGAFAQSNKLSKQIIGEWRNEYVKVKMNSYNNTGSTAYTEADQSNWEEKLHIKPIRTHFKPGGTYYSEYRNLKDSLVMMPSGNWIIKGDSIIMTQLKPELNILRMHVAIKNNVATFKGIIDFDGDGKADDEYYGVQKKFK